MEDLLRRLMAGTAYTQVANDFKLGTCVENVRCLGVIQDERLYCRSDERSEVQYITTISYTYSTIQSRLDIRRFSSRHRHSTALRNSQCK